MHPAIQAALVVLVLVAAIYDIRYRRIPNWLTVTGFLTGIGLNTALNGWTGLKTAAIGFAVAFGLYLFFYLLHAMGAGDAKLMAGVGALAGPEHWIYIFMLTALFGGLAAIVLVLSRGRLRTTLWNLGYLIRELSQFRAPYLKHEQLDVKSEKGLKLPHGVAIAVATLVYVAGKVLRG